MRPTSEPIWDLGASGGLPGMELPPAEGGGGKGPVCGRDGAAVGLGAALWAAGVLAAAAIGAAGAGGAT